LLTVPGLVCIQNDEPVSAICWNYSGPSSQEVMAHFYAESPRASYGSVQHILNNYLAKTRSACTHLFELWTAPEAKIHQVLPRLGFNPLARELMEVTSPAPKTPTATTAYLSRLNDFDLTASARESLTAMLYQSFSGTADGEFYEQYRSPGQCRAYLKQIIDSPFCDFRNSWIARSARDSRIIGFALCHFWPGTCGLYLEQFAVHPHFQGQGVGRILFSRLAAAVGQAGIRRIILTVTSNNLAARNLYRSLGARVLDTEMAYAWTNPGSQPPGSSTGTLAGASINFQK
jgi:ribosomal protein S18 acetylase RimI-like enzyme